MSRAALAYRAAELRRSGLLQREIAERLNISRSYASELLADPLGRTAIVRKDRFRKPCPDCGALMDGSNGNGLNASRHCAKCAPAYDPKKWEPQVILDLIQVWTQEHGRPPSVFDWSKPHARQFLFEKEPSPAKRRQLIAALSDGRKYPAPKTVAMVFGSWEAAIHAAGYVPRMRIRLSGEEIIARIRALSSDGVAPPGDTALNPVYNIAVARFGSWGAACHAADVLTRTEASAAGIWKRRRSKVAA
jgi:hypothetical protein